MSRPALTDRAALDKHRARALREGLADFLHRETASDLQERLEEINRRFTEIAVISGFPDLWSKLVLQARHVADTPMLDLAGSQHDLILHALALHWADDPVGQLIQCRRALKPDGLFLAAVFGGETLAALRTALAEAEAELAGGLSPRVAPMGEIRDYGSLLQRAGFALPVADSVSHDVRYENALHLMADLRAMGETNALAGRHRVSPPRRLFLRAAEIYQRNQSQPSEAITARFEVIFLTGWAPGPGQQQPLRPGSAERRLADMLNTTETPLPSSIHDSED